ncbi:CPBP family intramembrane glutamic endopeptidase [Actinocorallia sp. A-T 12471]|uniref:CPBP family intramembrane glutamic endopeptidase n=1 Tax=Actinocorallia sp. A-T 12471 TaxID=3089813 RepID=UPI0029D3AE9D|nr:CPBP family glutamic-type intramembrane protease [Actinocorallia sp. A-T 12471]MDX6738797.1 CPBP family glutamic-type intramembrane protease [Actinocorallia sp. A-T 12471]
MEPPEDAPPPEREDKPAAPEATSWAPVDPGPSFAPPEPQASWPAEHTYPLHPQQAPPPAQGPGYRLPAVPPSPGYRLPNEPVPYPPPPGPPGPYGPPPTTGQYPSPPGPEATGPYAPPQGEAANDPYAPPPGATGSYAPPPTTGPYAPPQGEAANGPYAAPPGATGSYGTPPATSYGPPQSQTATGPYGPGPYASAQGASATGPYGSPPATGPYASAPGQGATGSYAVGPAPASGPYATGPYASPYSGQGAGGAYAQPGQYATGAYAVPGYGPGYLVPGVHVPGQAGPWLVGPEPGVPFHRMDRTRLHRWWRPLVGTLTLGVGLFVVSVIVLVVWTVARWLITGEEPVLTEDGTGLFGGTVADLAGQLALIAVWLPLVFFVVWGIARRPPGTVVSVLGRMRWKWLGVCALVAVGYVVISYGLLVLVTALFGDDEPSQGAGFPGWAAVVAPLVVVLLLVPFQATAEEFVFRGWLLQAIGGCTLARPDGTYRNGFTRALGKVFSTPWPAIVITSAVFVAGHGYTGWAMVDIGLWAVACAWLAVKTGGLEAPIALHVLNNLVAFAVPIFAGELEGALDQGGAPAYILLADLPPLLFYVAVVLWLRRRMNEAVRTPGEPPEPKPLAAVTGPDGFRVEES